MYVRTYVCVRLKCLNETCPVSLSSQDIYESIAPSVEIAHFKIRMLTVLTHHSVLCILCIYISRMFVRLLDSIRFDSIQFNSIQFNSIQFNSIQFILRQAIISPSKEKLSTTLFCNSIPPSSFAFHTSLIIMVDNKYIVSYAYIYLHVEGICIYVIVLVLTYDNQKYFQ